jgi:hypothetical protein
MAYATSTVGRVEKGMRIQNVIGFLESVQRRP